MHVNEKEGQTRRADSDSDLCIDPDDDYRSSNGAGDSQSQHIRRNSISRVSIRLVCDDRNEFLAKFKNRE